MALDAQGTVITWNGVTLGEVTSIDLGFGTADATAYMPLNTSSRQKRFVVGDVDPGSVTVVLRTATAMSRTNVGLTGSLSIVGAGINESWAWAMFNEPKWRGTVNALQEYSVTFKLGG
jgi:hypothetical protein